jgi:ribose-phosphate pyrophosphokinase
MADGLKIFSGNSNIPLAQSICRSLDLPLGDAVVSRFSDGEIRIHINEDIRGTDVFLIQSTNAPAENLLELLLMLDAVKRSSARRVTAVIPYYGYARQDRKAGPRVPISAKVVANLITAAGADRVLTLDLHAPQIQGFFDIPLDHLYSAPVFTRRLRELGDPEHLVIASPDAGGMAMARSYGKRLNCPLALVDKRRPRPNVAEIVNVIGDVKGKNVIIRDDMIDTGGSLTGAAMALKAKGAEAIYGACTHALLSGQAVQRIEESVMTRLIVSDSILLSPDKQCSKLEVLSVAGLFGEAIRRIHEEKSISSLFDPTDQT